MTILRTISILAAGLGLFCPPVWAEKADRDKPMLIEADTMRHDETKLLTHFVGNVVAFKGSMVLRGARMEVQQNKQGQQVVQIWAAPQERVFFRQKREGLAEFTEGESEIAIYDSQADQLTLMQRAELRILRGTALADQLHGEKIVFNNNTEVMTIDGRAPGSPTATGRDQRVRAILTPRKNAPPPAASTTPGPTLRSSPSTGESQKP
jgi:lipopolysaccharide export system protein LptA